MYDLTALQAKTSGRPASTVSSVGGGGNLTAIIARAEEAIEAETAAIRTERDFDVKASNAKKSRHLYELSRAFKGLNGHDLPAEHRAAIERLREKLVRNEAVIRAHMNAVGEVADLIQTAIRNADADGTYSAGAFGAGGRG